MWLDEHMACKKMGTIGEAKDEAGMLVDFADSWPSGNLAWSPERTRIRPASSDPA